jgi:hypothetical protein
MNKDLLPRVLFFFFTLNIFAQDPAIGHWRDHLPYTQGVDVAKAGDLIFCASENGLFSYNTIDQSIERYSKVNGLSDIGFSKLNYNTETKSLIVVYQNSNIDVIEKNNITNIADIKRSNILGDKKIYGTFNSENFVYLATGFGIVVIDLKKKEIKDTYFIGPNGSNIKVNDVALHNNIIYAATDNGIYTASLSASNPADFNNWKKLDNLLNNQGKYNLLQVFENTLYINSVGTVFNRDSVFFLSGSEWKYFDKGNTLSNYSMEAYEDIIIFSNYGGITGYNKEGNLVKNIGVYFSNIMPMPRNVILDENKDVWIADLNYGLVYTQTGDEVKIIHPKGPASINANHIATSKNNVWISPGGTTDYWASLWRVNDISYFSEQEWKRIPVYLPGSENIFDILHISVNPQNQDQVFASSWGKGLLEINNGQMTTLYNETNSTIQQDERMLPNYKVEVSASAFDTEGNLWVANPTTSRPLSVKKKDGSWKSFEITGITFQNIFKNIIVGRNNYKWIPVWEVGLLVYNDQNTIDDESDDQYIILTTEEGKGKLPSKEVFSITEDLDGRIWIGTDQGVAVIYNPGAIFSGGNFDAQQVMLVQDGNVQILLENELISAIAVDGANRKWIGTMGGGAFLMSEDGTKQIEAFNASNSPLLSDEILSIAINPDGEVFFGTNKGVVSYRGTASEGLVNYHKVYAFPNPVRPDYEGPIAIRGLVQSADVKITDISGNLVHETRALGGQAIWDGKTIRGERAATGVYLVFISNDDGSKTTVTKILFVN